MASEITTTTVDDLTYSAAILNEAVLAALYEINNVRQLVRFVSLAGRQSVAADFPKRPKLAASSLTQGADMTATGYATSKATVTAGEVGIMLEPTDVANAATSFGNDDYVMDAASAVLNKLTTDITALLGSFSNTTGSTGVNLTEANVLDGTTTLMANSVPGPFAGVLHPQQYRDFAGSVGSTLTPAGAGGQTAQAATNTLGARPDGGLGGFYGVDWVITAAVQTANAGADRAGAILAPNRALGMVELWSARTEMSRDISKRTTEIVITADYGVGEVDDTSGVSVITDA